MRINNLKTLFILPFAVLLIGCPEEQAAGQQQWNAFQSATSSAGNSPTAGYNSPVTERRTRSPKLGGNDRDEELPFSNVEIDAARAAHNCPKNGTVTISTRGENLAADANNINSALTKDECKHFSKFKKAIPAGSHNALKQALRYRSLNRSKFKGNSRYISIADYSQSSTQKRFYELDMMTGKVVSRKVSHGRGKGDYGDPEHDGRMNTCKNRDGSRTNMTRPGFFKTSETYGSRGSCTSATYKKYKRQYGVKPSNFCGHGEFRNSSGTLVYGWPLLKNGKDHNAMRMDGLTPGVNDQARNKGVVMHGAWYNSGRVMGRSYGCPAFAEGEAPKVINKIQGGSLYYSYTPQCPKDMAKIEKQVPGWQGMCGG